MTYVFGDRQIFGRDSELATLRQAYERVSKTGYGEIVLVGGPAGYGKTTVVNAFLGNSKNLRIAIGKADETLRRVPYNAVLKALGWLLPADELEELTRVRDAGALSSASRVRDRLIETIQRNASPTEPLVMFVDDIQWLDDSSVRLMRALSEKGIKDMLLVATYRPDDSKQFRERGLADFLGNSAVRVTDILLKTLPYEAVEGLISAQRYGDTAKSLARLVQSVAAGNPFHIQLILDVLNQAESAPDLAQFVSDQKNWGLHSLLGRIISEFPKETRSILEFASCVGFQSAHSILGAATYLNMEQIERALQPATALGLIRTDGHTCQFAHDAVREYVRKTLDRDQRTALHARIARSMLQAGAGSTDQHLAVAEQIVKAKYDPILLEHAAIAVEALYQGAQIAKTVGAPEGALRYAEKGIELIELADVPASYVWDFAELRCTLLVEIHGAAVDDAELESLRSLAASPLQEARAIRLKAAVLILRGKFEEAIEGALWGLHCLGICVPRRPSKSEIDEGYKNMRTALATLSLENISSYPRLQDKAIVVAMDLLATLQASFFSDDNLKFLHVAKIVELSAIHGVSEATCYGLAWCGVAIASEYGDYHTALAMAEAAVALSHETSFQGYRTSALVALDQVSVWLRPLSYSLSRAREAFEHGKSSGDLTMACFATNHVVSDLLAMGAPLSVVANEANRGIAMATSVGFVEVVRILEVQLAFVKALRERTFEPGELVTLATSDRASEMSPLVFWGHLFDGIAAVFHGHMQIAADYLRNAAKWKWTTPAHIHIADLHFYSALVAQILGDDIQGRVHRAAVEEFARHNPTTFTNKLKLIDAEISRAAGDTITALRFYEESISAARSAELWQELAFAHERAAQLARDAGLPVVTAEHIRQAQSCYRKWGASQHAERLRSEFADILSGSLESPAEPNHIDLSVGLTSELVVAAAKFSGAMRGQLISVEGDALSIVANTWLRDGVANIISNKADFSNEMAPASIIKLVKESAHSLRYGHASLEAGADHGASLRECPVKSLLCVPLKEQDRVFSVLYLENNAVSDAFSYETEQAIELFALASAKAILLKSQLEANRSGQAAQQFRESELVNARADLIKNSHITVLGGMAASIAHEVNQPLSAIVTHANAGLRWIRQSVPQLDKAINNFEKIEQASIRASSIIQALRSLAKQSPANLEFISMNDVINDVLEVVKTDSRTEGVEIDCSLADGGLIFADSIQVQQVVLNLITNALDSMEGQIGPKTLRIKSDVRETSVVVAVSDSGSGIPASARDSIFDPFFTTKGNGLGMGLAICKTIAEVHGGGLSIGSSNASGTTMIFNLPVTVNPTASSDDVSVTPM